MASGTRATEAKASDLVSIFKALSDATRLRIVSLLTQGDLCVGELEYILGVSQTNVSRHLDRLRRAGLVTSRKQAQWVYCGLPADLSLRHPAVADLISREMSGTEECAADLRALRRYRESGMTCEELPNCRRNRTPRGKAARKDR